MAGPHSTDTLVAFPPSLFAMCLSASFALSLALFQAAFAAHFKPLIAHLPICYNPRWTAHREVSLAVLPNIEFFDHHSEPYLSMTLSNDTF